MRCFLCQGHMVLSFLDVLASGCLPCLKCWLCRQLSRFSLCVCDICISLSTHTCGCWGLSLGISVMMPLQLIGQLLSERRVSVWCTRPLAGHPQIQRPLSCRGKIKQSLQFNSCSLFTSQLYSRSAFNKTQGCIIMSITESKLMPRDKHSAYQKHSAQYSHSRTQLSFVWNECTFFFNYSQPTHNAVIARGQWMWLEARWSWVALSAYTSFSTLTSSVPGWLISFVSIDSFSAASWLMSIIFNLTQCPLITSSSWGDTSLPPTSHNTSFQIVDQNSEWIWIGQVLQEVALEWQDEEFTKLQMKENQYSW